MTKRQKKLLTRIIIAAVIYIAGIFLPLEGIPQLTLYLLCYAVIGWDIVWKAITNITHGQMLRLCYFIKLVNGFNPMP